MYRLKLISWQVILDTCSTFQVNKNAFPVKVEIFCCPYLSYGGTKAEKLRAFQVSTASAVFCWSGKKCWWDTSPNILATVFCTGILLGLPQSLLRAAGDALTQSRAKSRYRVQLFSDTQISCMQCLRCVFCLQSSPQLFLNSAVKSYRLLSASSSLSA